jgi:hypothetical protein
MGRSYQLVLSRGVLHLKCGESLHTNDDLKYYDTLEALEPSEQAAVTGIDKTYGSAFSLPSPQRQQFLPLTRLRPRWTNRPSAFAPRVAELHCRGEIRPTAARGKNASGMTARVWAVSPSLPTTGGQS